MRDDVYDVLVIGSGIAGLSFALEMAEAGTVLLTTKKDEAESATNYAQGGIAAAIGDNDSVEAHIRDTLTTGAGLCKREAVELVARDGPAKIKRLMEWGANFTLDKKGELALGREGGHTRDRIVHKADHTGREVERALLEQVRAHPNVTLSENKEAIDIVTDRHLCASHRQQSRRCYGAYVHNADTNQVELVRARLTLLATGGMGCIWLNTTNPSIATGDGVAMSWRAGALIANLEFMQFHPTALFTREHRERAFLISEAVRGFGGILLNFDGRRFMEDVHPQKELAPRDVVARTIDAERKRWGIDHVWLDVTHLDKGKLIDRFPTIYETLFEEYDIDITCQRIPVVPAAHYQCGGVVTDTDARTTIKRLYAAGEVACTGLHGANRLASNSLLEAVVFASRAAESAKMELAESNDDLSIEIPPWDDSGTYDPEEWVLIEHDRNEVRKLMEDYVGIVRSDARLYRAERRLDLISREIEEYWRRTVVNPELVELRNIVQVARLVVRSALSRKESRGLHYTTSYPELEPILGARDTVI